jgi:tetratricopeptide (TPR) repeat protein
MNSSDKDTQQVPTSQDVLVQHTQYNEYWWQQKKRTLYKAFQEAPLEGLNQWQQTYAELLLAWELALCEKLTNETFPFPSDAFAMAAFFQSRTQAIKQKRYQEALDMLVYLTNAILPNSSQHILNETSRATLLVFIGRIYLYEVFDAEAALKYFEQAKDLAPNDGLPYSALGDYYRRAKDAEKAELLYTQTLKQSPKQPDGYIGKGLLAEDQARFSEANDYYKEAIEAVGEERDIDVALSKLLAPLNGNVYLQLAHVLRKRQDLEQALQAVAKAPDMGIRDEMDYPERTGYRLKGELLEELQRPVESAEAYYEAARRFNRLSNFRTAIKLLTRAHNLNSSDPYICWELSDALRMSSYPMLPSDEDEISLANDYDDEEIPHVDQAIKKSLEFWEQAYKIGLLDQDLALFYYERVLINDQLASLPRAAERPLYWEGITYLERALLRDDTNSDFWTFLGYFHHMLGKELNAFYALTKAIEYDDKNLRALYQLVSLLVLSGQTDEAEKVIGKLQEQQWSRALAAREAYIRFYKGFYRDALELISHLIEDEEVPPETWYRELRAACYLMLDEPMHAKEEFVHIWEPYEKSNFEPSNEDRLRFGRAACHIDKLDKAVDIFSLLCENSSELGEAYCGLGFAYLRQGNLQYGEESLAQGIAEASNQRELESLVKIDFSIMKKVSATLPYGAQVYKILDRLQEKINIRSKEIEQSRSREDELRRVVETNLPKDGTINWAWLAAQAGLARLYTERGLWDNAKEVYQSLQYQREQFPEAQIGLEKVRSGLQAAANVAT